MDVLNNYNTDALSNMQKQIEQLRMQTPNTFTFGQPSTNLIWVQGIEGAKGYQVPNRSNTLLLDSENENTMYIISSDEVGMRKMRMFRFEEIEIKQPGQVDMEKYCTKEDVKNIILEMMAAKKGEHNDAIIS